MSSAAVAPSRISLICGAVLVSLFDGAHRVHTVFAHVLATGPEDEKGNPSLTVAFPDPNASHEKLATAKWYEAYKRVSGVLHVSHPDVQAGKVSIAYGGTIAPASALAGTGPEIPQPAGDGSRPYFKRESPVDAPRVSVGQKQATLAKETATGVVTPPSAEAQGAPAAAPDGNSAPAGDAPPAAQPEATPGAVETPPSE